MKNSELLEFAGSNRLLAPLDSQRRFLLRQFVQPRPCPNCATKQNWFEAQGIGIDDWDFGKGSSADRKFRCAACKRELNYALPIFGGAWYWSLVPIPVQIEQNVEKQG